MGADINELKKLLLINEDERLYLIAEDGINQSFIKDVGDSRYLICIPKGFIEGTPEPTDIDFIRQYRSLYDYLFERVVAFNLTTIFNRGRYWWEVENTEIEQIINLIK